MEPERMVAYVVDHESFGMGRMFDHYGFSLTLSEATAGTTVTLHTYLSPRNLVFAAMNALFVRRQMMGV